MAAGISVLLLSMQVWNVVEGAICVHVMFIIVTRDSIAAFYNAFIYY